MLGTYVWCLLTNHAWEKLQNGQVRLQTVVVQPRSSSVLCIWSMETPSMKQGCRIFFLI